MKPEDLTVIGYVDDLLADIYAAENGAYLNFTVVLNDSGETAQSRRNRCSISAVEVRNLGRNTQAYEPHLSAHLATVVLENSHTHSGVEPHLENPSIMISAHDTV